jgi:hypothetical protein
VRTFTTALISFTATIMIAVLLNSFGPIFGTQTHVIATGAAFFTGITTFRLLRCRRAQP